MEKKFACWRNNFRNLMLEKICQFEKNLKVEKLIWINYKSLKYVKLGPHDAWFVFVMRHASWFAHLVYEKMCLIWVDLSFVHSSHLVRQLGGKLKHQSKLYVSDSTNLFDTFTHDAPRIRITHRMDPALKYVYICMRMRMRHAGLKRTWTNAKKWFVWRSPH